ncbi:MAG: peptidase C39 family protein [Nocardioides sp.]|uniref:peptidase C39 family protein n=1 Tax=Nocardioides sp. TaxID=35761 RepID=UPI003F032C3C
MSAHPSPTVRTLGAALAATTAGLLTSSLLVAPASAATGATAATSTAAPAAKRTVTAQHTSWSTSTEFRTGVRRSVKVSYGNLSLRNPKVKTYLGRRYDYGSWTSPWVTPGMAATEIIPSWEATTPGDSLVQVMVRAKLSNGRTGTWDTVADWALDNRKLKRTTYSGQTDDLGKVNVDTWQATKGVTGYQLRIVLMRASGTTSKPTVQRFGALASIRTGAPATSKVGKAAGTVLGVPRYSQMTHTGHLPQYGGGGEAWCSPTSTAMVLAYYGYKPTPVGVPGDHANAVVDHTARLVYDHGYGGTGNWAFNTAYAASHVKGDAYVTRLADLRATEAFISDGVPLIVSIAFRKGELSGAPISSSNGHLVVLVGFDKDGNAVVNDPAGARNSAVRRTYDRAQFEKVWLNASSGTAYVIRNS